MTDVSVNIQTSELNATHSSQNEDQATTRGPKEYLFGFCVIVSNLSNNFNLCFGTLRRACAQAKKGVRAGEPALLSERSERAAGQQGRARA